MNTSILKNKPLCGFIFIMFTVLSLTSSAQSLPKKGDVSGDGIIDGRDALKILRHIRGMEVLNQEELLLADVFPVDEMNPTISGDGTLTDEDAMQILRASVGLIPESDISGDILQYKPIINSFDPQRGSAGEMVTITGRNFFSTRIDDNIILFGDIQAEIESISNTQVVVTIPENAVSNPITIMTPGGASTSSAIFQILNMIGGKLDLENISIADLTIVGSYGETTEISSNGDFDLPLPHNDISIVGAVTSGDNNNTYMSIVAPSLNPESPQINTIQLDELSTAKALVFMHPYFASRNKAAANYILFRMDELEEIQELANVIRDRYPAGADGIDDPQVRAAWKKAVNALLNSLPGEISFNVETTPTINAKKTSRVLTINEYLGGKSDIKALSLNHSGAALKTMTEDDIDVHVYSAGVHYVVADYNEETRRIEIGYPETNDYSPVDWIGAMYRIDPADLTYGVGNPFLVAKREHVRTGYNVSTMLEANLWTSKIDILGQGIDAVMGPVLDWVSVGEDGLPLEDMEDGVYILRLYSGVVRGNDSDDVETLAVLKDGKIRVAQAAALNISIAITDLLGLLGGDDEEDTETIMKIALQHVQDVLLQEMTNTFVYTQPPKDILELLVEALQGAAENAVDHLIDKGKSHAQKKLKRVSLQVFKSSFSILDSLSKLSTVGQVGERLAGVMGYLLNVYDLELSNGATPLENYVIVVGNPFKPEIIDFSPKEGGHGELVTIKGKRFLLEQDDGDLHTPPKGNIVHFGSYQAQVIEVRSSEEIVVQVPDGLSALTNVEVSVKTTASPSKAVAEEMFFVNPKPIITSISPDAGYGEKSDDTPDIYNHWDGTTVEIKGFNFNGFGSYDECKVFFGEHEAEVTYLSSNRINVRVPSLPKDSYPVTVRAIDRGLSSQPISFFIYGPPELNSVTPEEIKAGELLQISGIYLNEAIVTIDGQQVSPELQNKFNFNAILYNVKPEGGEIEIRIANPAGEISTTVSRVSGIVAPELTPLGSGINIVVASRSMNSSPDGIISLKEAFEFANGTINPFTPPYDDASTVTDVTFEEYTESVFDEEGNESIVVKTRKTGQKSSQIITGPAHDYHETYHHTIRLDKTVDSTLISRVGLDDGENGLEEGDQVGWGMFNDFENFNGANMSDDIIYIGTEALHLTSLNIEDFDSFEVKTANLTVDENIVINKGALLSAGNVNVGGSIQLAGHRAILAKATVTSGNSAVIIEEDILGCLISRSVNIISSQEHGILVNKGGGHTITPATVSNCVSNGYYFINSDENYFGEYNDITSAINCGGAGIVFEGGRVNRIPQVNIAECGTGLKMINTRSIEIGSLSLIRDCLGDGIVIQGGTRNKLDLVRSINNKGHGFVIVDGFGHFLEDLTAANNEGDGLHISGNSQHNRIQYVETYNNTNGVSLTGPDCIDNICRLFSVGFYMTNTGEAEYAGNRKNGIYLYGGANHNFFDSSTIYDSGEHGILIENEGTDNNEFLRVNSGAAFEFFEAFRLPKGNVRDGIRIQDGARYNVINTGAYAGNGGNGATIDGENTFGNVFNGAGFGTRKEDLNGEILVYPNMGYGMVIQNNAMFTGVNSCAFAYNDAGGLFVDNISAQNNEFPTVIENCSFGFNSMNPSTGDELEDVPGIALELNNCQGITVTDCVFNNYDNALFIHGIHSDSIFLDQINQRNANGTGFLFENTKNIILNRCFAMNNLAQGIVVTNSESIAIKKTMAAENQNNGYLIQNCNDISFIDSSARNNNENALSLLSTRNFELNIGNFYSNFKNGVIVDQQCSDMKFNQLHLESNSDYGLNIQNSSNILVINDNREIKNMARNNKLGAIILNNVQTVRVGTDGRGFELIGDLSEGPNLSIKGNETKDVVVESIVSHTSIAEENVLVEGGQEIILGSADSNLGNYIAGSENVGLRIAGANTKVKILNNHIGKIDLNNQTYELALAGNMTGLMIEDQVSGIVVQNNEINHNLSDGVVVHDDANKIRFTRNIIHHNSGHGIRVDGAGCDGIFISQNSISQNENDGIALLNGANKNIASPNITNIFEQRKEIIGRVDTPAPDGSTVEVYADRADEGEIFLGSSQLFGNAFSVSANKMPPGMVYHALIVHPNGNTSTYGDFKTSPTGSKRSSYVYTTELSGKKTILAQDQYRFAPVRLTALDSNCFDPHVNRNRNDFIYVSDRNGNLDIRMGKSDSPQTIQLTTNEHDDYDPAWNPAGDAMVFVSERDGNSEIYLQNIETNSTPGALQHFYGEAEWGFGNSVGGANGVWFPSEGGTLSRIQFYIYESPSEFQWKIMSMGESFPEDVLAEGMASPTETGWYAIDIEPLAVEGDFAVLMFFTGESEMRLGITYDGEAGYGLFYSSYSEEWQTRNTLYMIRAEMVPPGPIRITYDDAIDRDPVFSPDGKQIAFMSERSGKQDIWILSLETGELQNLTNGLGNNYQPDWNAFNESSIAFVSDRNGNPDIYMLHVHSGEVKRLTANIALDQHPTWYYDTNIIHFSSNAESDYEIYQITANNGNLVRLTISAGPSMFPEGGAVVLPSIPIYAQINNLPTLELSLPKQSGNKGDILTMELAISGAANLGNLAFDLAYDPFILELVEMPLLSIAEESLFALYPDTVPSTEGKVRLNWIKAEGLSNQENVMTLNFNILEEAQKEETLIRFHRAAGYDVFLSPFAVRTVNGTITINDFDTPVTDWQLYQ